MILRTKRHQVKKLNLKNNLDITSHLLTNKDFFFYTVKENIDWQKFPKQEMNEIVSISNDHYFGFRALEKDASIIFCDVNKIDNLIRLSKDSLKFNGSVLYYFNIDDLNPKIKRNPVDISKYIAEQIELIKKTSMDKIIIGLNTSDLSIDVLEIISYLYNYPLALVGKLSTKQMEVITEKEIVNLNITL